MKEGSVTWRLLYRFFDLVIRNSHVERDVQQRTRRQLLQDAVARGFGSSSTIEDRHVVEALPPTILYLMTMAVVVPVAICGYVMVLIGLDRTTIATSMLVVGIPAFAPFVTLIIWAVRGTVSEVQFHRWRRAGRPEGVHPVSASNPRDSDLLWGAPWALAMVGWAIWIAFTGLPQFFIDA